MAPEESPWPAPNSAPATNRTACTSAAVAASASSTSAATAVAVPPKARGRAPNRSLPEPAAHRPSVRATPYTRKSVGATPGPPGRASAAYDTNPPYPADNNTSATKGKSMAGRLSPRQTERDVAGGALFGWRTAPASPIPMSDAMPHSANTPTAPTRPSSARPSAGPNMLGRPVVSPSQPSAAPRRRDGANSVTRTDMATTAAPKPIPRTGASASNAVGLSTAAVEARVPRLMAPSASASTRPGEARTSTPGDSSSAHTVAPENSAVTRPASPAAPPASRSATGPTISSTG